MIIGDKQGANDPGDPALQDIERRLLAVEEQQNNLSDRQLAVEKRCILLGITSAGSKHKGSRLSEPARRAAEQMIRILNQTLADTGFDMATMKSYVACAQIFEPEYAAKVSLMEGGESEGGRDEQ